MSTSLAACLVTSEPGSHRHTDVGLLDGGRVVYRVARHRHDLAAVLEALDEPQLVLRGDPPED